MSEPSNASSQEPNASDHPATPMRDQSEPLPVAEGSAGSTLTPETIATPTLELHGASTDASLPNDSYDLGVTAPPATPFPDVVPEAARTAEVPELDPIPLAAPVTASPASRGLTEHNSTHAPVVSTMTPGVVLPERGRPILVLIGGTIGILACVAGLTMLMGACAGYEPAKTFKFAEYVMYAGIGGLLLAVVGGLFQKKEVAEETAVMGAIFPNILAIIGGVLEWYVFNGWKIL